MALTATDFQPRELDLLRTLKNQGKSAKQAFDILQSARKKLGTSFAPPRPQVPSGPFVPPQVAARRGLEETAIAPPQRGELEIAEQAITAGPVLPSPIARRRGVEQDIISEGVEEGVIPRVTAEEAREQKVERLREQAKQFKQPPFPIPGVEPAIKGLTKSVAETAATITGLGRKAAGLIAGEDIEVTDFEKGLLKYSQPESVGERVAKVATDIGTAVLSGGAGAALGKRAIGGLAAKAGKFAPAATFASQSLGSTSAIVAADEGRLPTLSEVGAGAALDGIFLGLGKALKPERLISKAMGLTPTQKRSLSRVASSSRVNGKPIYKNIDDFALKNKITGGRKNMVVRAKELFEEATTSKKSLLKNIKKKTSNKFDDLFDYLRRTYSQPGQQRKLATINRLGKKKTLSAVELDTIRKLADDSLPSSAFTGAEPVRVEGIENLIAPVRKTLGELDLTGQIKKANLHKRLLNELGGTSKSLTKALEQASGRSVIGQAGFRGGTAGAAATGAQFIPGVGEFVAPVAATVGALETLLAFPQVSSFFANLNKTGALDKALEGAAPAVKQQVLDLVRRFSQ